MQNILKKVVKKFGEYKQRVVSLYQTKQLNIKTMKNLMQVAELKNKVNTHLCSGDVTDPKEIEILKELVFSFEKLVKIKLK